MSNPHSFGRHCKYPLVIARSAATWQSMQFEFMDCRATLAMTAGFMENPHKLSSMKDRNRCTTEFAGAVLNVSNGHSAVVERIGFNA